MPKKAPPRIKPGFSPSEARDIVRIQREAQIGQAKSTQVLARKYRRDPAYLAARRWVWEQRRAGHSPEAIAALSEEHFGEKITWPRVEAMIISADVDVDEPEAKAARTLENARLDWYLECLEHRIRAGDDKAINTAIRISERRARMNGFDKPQEIHAHVTNNVDPAVLEAIAEARDEQRRSNQTGQDIVDVEFSDDDDDGYIDLALPGPEED